MVSPSPALAFKTNFDPQTGHAVPIAAGVMRIAAPNRNAYTFTGTNSFVLGQQSVAVVDPGPDDPHHLAALLKTIAGRQVDAIILTHTHRDHSALAIRLKAATGAPLWFGGGHRLSRPRRLGEINLISNSSDWSLRPDRTLHDGEHFLAGGLELETIATPGHCANHLAFGLTGTKFLLSGDHVMGWSTTLVSVPDGSMTDYLASLDKLLAMPFTHYLPAHGDAIADGRAYANALRTHRELRNRQIMKAIEDGAKTIGNLLERIYPTLSLTLHAAARMTLTAHIEYLVYKGRITAKRGLFGWRLG